MAAGEKGRKSLGLKEPDVDAGAEHAIEDNGAFSGAVAALQKGIGLLRSWLIYYGQPLRHRSLVRFYDQFIGPGDLCFDLGAHLGNRSRAWLELGARVVAVEPQPICVSWLRRRFGDRARFQLVEKAVGAVPGTATLWLSRLTPSVSTVSPAWRRAVADTPGFAGVRWQDSTEVEVTTLDELIELCGVPAFCKIDVEGAELEVLQGCSTPLPALSFEFIPAATDTALGCIDRLMSLARYEFQWGVGEPPQLEADDWLSPSAMKAVLRGMPREAGAGDVYARHKS